MRGDRKRQLRQTRKLDDAGSAVSARSCGCVVIERLTARHPAPDRGGVIRATSGQPLAEGHTLTVIALRQTIH